MKTDVPPGLPEANLKPPAKVRLIPLESGIIWWALPFLAAMLVIYIVFFQSVFYPPVNVHVIFSEGGMVAKGDPVKFMNVEIGYVEQIKLDRAPESREISLRVGLHIDPEYLDLIAEDSLFWIERPMIGLGGIQGLDTLTRGSHIGFRPGASHRTARDFRGENDPPPLRKISSEGLQIILESQKKSGLVPGAFVNFRGFKVGQIESVSLAPDSSTVESRAYIYPEFKNLVRDNTIFWMDTEFKTDSSLMGFEMRLGLNAPGFVGVALSTPTEAGGMVAPEKRFKLKTVEETKKNEATWLSFIPNIPLSSGQSSSKDVKSHFCRVEFAWREPGRWWGQNEKTLTGCGLKAAPGVILLPASLLDVPLKGKDCTIGFGGESFKTMELSVSGDEFLKIVQFGKTASMTEPKSVAAYRAEFFVEGGVPVDCNLLYCSQSGGKEPQIAMIRKEKLSPEGKNWRIGAEIPIPMGTDHAPVLSLDTGKIVGFLAKDSNGYFISRGK